jgi:uncharacterized zinc-type alcohol dehydrogenase-like protein
MLKRDGTLCLVGAPDQPHPSPAVFNLILGRRRLAGSPIGGIAETGDAGLLRRAWDRLGRRVIPIERINEAYERMLKGDVKYRFVIDLATLA